MPLTPPKPLVVILCETRAHEATFESFKAHVLDALGADLALCVSEGPREDPSNSFYTHAKYVWTCPEYDDWGDGLDTYEDGLHPNWRDWARLPSQWLGGIKTEPKHSGSAGILLVFRAFLRAQLQKLNLLDAYTHIIVTRSDFVWRLPHPPLTLLPEGRFWVPHGEMYFGLTDRHIVLPSHLALSGLTLTHHLKQDPSIHLSDWIAKDEHWNIERVIKASFANQNILQFMDWMPYIMFSVRLKGGHTSWREGSYREDLGLFVKYQGEFHTSRKIHKRLAGAPWTQETFDMIMAHENPPQIT